MAKKLASILIPTRNRFDSLLKAIESITSTTEHLDSVEILVRFDEDDENSLKRINELPKDKIDINVMVGKRYGYTELHRYVNEMCEQTKGEFIVWFNDDCIIETSGWDRKIAKYVGQVVCFYPNHRGTGSGNIFPIINRQIYETLGHFSLAQQVDTWQSFVCNRAGLQIRMDGMVFIHNRKQDYVSDENRKGVMQKTRKVWNNTKKKRAEDVKKLKEKFNKKLLKKEKEKRNKKKEAAKKNAAKKTQADKKTEEAKKAARAARWRKAAAAKEAAEKKAEDTKKREEAKKAARVARWKKAVAAKEAAARKEAAKARKNKK